MRIATFRPGRSNRPRLIRLLLAALAVTLLAVIAAGCGDDEDSTPAPAAKSAPADSSTVNGVMKEYSIVPDKTVVTAGDVKFKMSNEGKLLHEFIVIKTDLAVDKLPDSKSAPGKIDEDAHSLSVIGEIEDLEPGETDEKTFNVKPGNYVLICNISGHYGAGQRVALKAQ